MANDIIYELKDVSFSYFDKIPALRDINMIINKGKKVTVIGANGCGKSTLLQMLDALIFPEKGYLKFLGQELNEESFNNQEFFKDFRKKVGFVFQNPDIQLFCPSVKEDIVFGPLQLGMEKGEVFKRLGLVSDILQIGHLLDRSPHQLSVGEKRKVAIASVLIINPDVLIFDEPTAGLDPLTTRHIIDLLIQENEQGKTVITSTHDLHIVEEISDLVYVFSQEKRIIRSGPPEVILKDAALLEANNLAHIHRHRHKDSLHTHHHLHLHHHIDG